MLSSADFYWICNNESNVNPKRPLPQNDLELRSIATLKINGMVGVNLICKKVEQFSALEYLLKILYELIKMSQCILINTNYMNLKFRSFQYYPTWKNSNFRAFDHNGDGTISKDELKEAMQRFGHSFTEDECDEMFVQVWICH